MKGRDKILEDQLSKQETGNLPKREFRVMITKMIQEPGKRIQA